jgi:LPPG:FO 2-phospho-L-lactate transferase
MKAMLNSKPKVLALAGGVGGAKLATGLQAALPAGALTVVVNTGDDFEHWGLTICPDLDTVIYNLAGINNRETGWGRADERFTTLETMSLLGGEEWFRLGDQDLALHLRRTEWLRQNISLTEVTERLRRILGVTSQVLPMCDEPVRTLVHTDEGDLPFQHYFVRRRCEPLVIDVSFVGTEGARISDAVHGAIAAADLIVICPSNPYLSIDPILSIPHMRTQLLRAAAPIVAVTPIVGGEALKGPAAKMMREMGEMISPLTVADHYADLLDGFVLDRADGILRDSIDVPVLVTNTVMTDMDSKVVLAREVLAFGALLEGGMKLEPDSLDAKLSS